MSMLLVLEILSWAGLVLAVATAAVMFFALATGRESLILPLGGVFVLILNFDSWCGRRRNELKKTNKQGTFAE